MSMTVSCIVPLYRPDPGFLRSAVASVLAQTETNVELVLVDDGSPGDTSWIDASWANCARIVRKANGGPASARNAGIAAAHGDAVAFLDADDEWLPDKLSLQLEILRKRPEVGLVYSQVVRIDPAGNPLGIAPDTTIAGSAFQELFERNVIPTSTVMVRRSVLNEVGVFPEHASFFSAEDYDLWLRVAERHQIACLPEPSTRYRMHPEGISRNTHRSYLAEKRVIENAVSRSHGRLTDILKPRLHRLYFNYAHELFSNAKYEEAREQFVRALMNEPLSWRTWVYLAGTFAGDRVVVPVRRARRFLRGSA